MAEKDDAVPAGYKVVKKKYLVKKTKHKMEKRLTPDEVKQLLDSITEATHKSFWKRNRAIIQLLLNTGLRVGELAQMKVYDFLEVGVAGKIKSVLDVRPEVAKRKKAAQIPLNETARLAVKDLLEGRANLSYTDPLVAKPSGRSLSKRAIQDIVTTSVLKAGIQRLCGPHTLRHTFLSRVYELTQNARLTSDLARHAQVSLTLSLYCHSTMQGLTNAVSLLDEKDKAG